MRTIKIKKNTNGDSRVATKVPTIDEFIRANHAHTREVEEMMSCISAKIAIRGASHDYTKRTEPHKSQFYRDLSNTIEGKMKFEEGEWVKHHYTAERHHLTRHCPEDVNLIDVLEMICDCVCAGIARSGEVRPLTLDSDILQKAVTNTAKLCEGMVILED
ncbi:MAG: hypothetical protein IJV14_06405 [Lachnospiraceae bacterium]|nr:hypothetical protein [Lachnospiraceae bacterium]